ncbi:hypothetical protein Droror1_Dr00018413 [Drosera rotundifolia]
MTTGAGIEMSFFPANFILQSPHGETDHQLHQHQHQQHHQHPSSLSSILPTCSPHDFHGVAPMLGKRSMSFTAIDMCEESNNNGCGGGEEDLSDDGSLAGEKKRRLNMEQVKTLEKNFELGNKLEPERKMQLAKALGLQPRQIAIWFQNRRARWKTKQLEKDYEVLKREFDSLKADNEALQSHNHKLQAEVLALRNREPTESINLNKETDQGSCSNRSENSSEIKLDISTTQQAPPPAPAALNSQPTSIPLFPPSSSSFLRQSSDIVPPPLGHHQPHLVVAQLFPKPDVQCQKYDHPVKEESFSNMFVGIDDQTGFWPWLEQHHFN